MSNTAALPVFAEAARHRANYGLLGALTFHKRRHTVKTGFGLTRFPVRESFTIAITDLKGLLEREPELPVAAQGFTLTNPFFFNARRRGWEASAYAQDHINATRFPAKILDDVNFTRGFIRPHTVFDFATGRDFSLSERVLLAAQLNIQNLADRFYLITFDSLSSGVAIGRPRAVSGKLTVSFK